MVNDTPEGEVPDFPKSNPRNATDEKGNPRNPAVSHPLPSQGFPDNDGDMASAPTITTTNYPDGVERVIVTEGVPKGPDIPDSELPEEQRADYALGGMPFRERFERDHPEAVADDPSEPDGQPVDKFGYPLRKGADPDAQTTGENNPDNPDGEYKSDRYLGEPHMGNAEESANTPDGIPKKGHFGLTATKAAVEDDGKVKPDAYEAAPEEPYSDDPDEIKDEIADMPVIDNILPEEPLPGKPPEPPLETTLGGNNDDEDGRRSRKAKDIGVNP